LLAADRRRNGRLVVAGLVTALVAGGCHSSPRAAPGTGNTTTTAIPTTTSTSPALTSSTAAAGPTDPLPTLKLDKLAQLNQPIAAAVRPGGDGTLYIAQKNGKVFTLKAGATTQILDLSGQVTTGGEQGLLSLAISPADKLYVDYTDTRGDTRVVEYGFAGAGVNPASQRQVLFVHQPFANHNGGEVTFGPDGHLYVGLGDGGSEHDPNNQGQSLNTLLGKILRIDPAPSGSQPYSIPADNPFVGRPDVRPEIWAYGLRNPWRFTFDRVTHDQWIGDVGQDHYEEIDHVAAGRGGVNYGWNRREGLHAEKGDLPPGAVDPVYEYSHAHGRAVIGGYVYRGSKIRGLGGAYLFADAYQTDIRALVPSGSGLKQVATGLSGNNIGSFATDADGELLVLALSGGVFRVSAA
jgi:glucose/arabinose dehydrogenase